MKDRQYEVGDQVSWESSAAGTTRRKKGVVVRVVPANQLPAQKNLGIARRNHVSYVVSAIAEGTQTERKRLYWPRASQLSLVVDNPLLAAKHAASILTSAGYTANVREPPMGDLGKNALVLVETNALMNGCIVFRWHALKMGKPPNQRTISTN